MNTTYLRLELKEGRKTFQRYMAHVRRYWYTGAKLAAKSLFGDVIDELERRSDAVTKRVKVELEA